MNRSRLRIGTKFKWNEMKCTCSKQQMYDGMLKKSHRQFFLTFFFLVLFRQFVYLPKIDREKSCSNKIDISIKTNIVKCFARRERERNRIWCCHVTIWVNGRGKYLLFFIPVTKLILLFYNIWIFLGDLLVFSE